MRKKWLSFIFCITISIIISFSHSQVVEASRNGWYYSYEANLVPTLSGYSYDSIFIEGNTLCVNGSLRKASSKGELFGENSKISKRKDWRFKFSDKVKYYNSLGEEEPYPVSKEDFSKMGYVDILFHVKGGEIVYIKGALH